MLITTITAKFLSASLTRTVSLVPRPRPKPRIGPISGEMSIAPMITGMELRLRPTEAMTIAQARMNTLGPRKSMLPRMLAEAACTSTWSRIFTRLAKNFVNLLIPANLKIYKYTAKIVRGNTACACA